MNRGELHAELERIGSLPVPVPDRRRVDAIEQQLYREFAVPSSPSGPSPRSAARRRRRQVLLAGLSMAAAVAVAVAVLHRGGSQGLELQGATSAVMLLPDGHSRAVRAGDEIPEGGLLQTGPAGSVTIDGTKVGPDQLVLVGDEGLTLLPASSPPAPEPVPPIEEAPTSAVAPSHAPAVPPADSVAPPPSAPPSSATEPVPAAAAVPVAGTLGLVVGEEAGGVHLAWTATAADDFERYVVVRGTVETRELVEIAQLRDRQITSFTDPAAPHGVALLFRVVAMGTSGRPVAISEVVELTLQDTGSTSGVPTSTDPNGTPPTTEPSGSVLSIPPPSDPASTSTTSTTSVPPTTDAGSPPTSDAPSSTVAPPSTTSGSAPPTSSSNPGTTAP